MKSFRNWVAEKWFEYKRECIVWKTTPCKEAQEYFKNNKWFLKALYKSEKREYNSSVK
jgi:hypothetical protein